MCRRDQKNLKKFHAWESFFELRLTEVGVHYILENGVPVCSMDFTGYLFPIHNKYGIYGVVDTFGNFGMCSIDEKHPKISEKMELKILKNLMKTHFLSFTIEPFPEFNPVYELPLDPDVTQFVDTFLFYNYTS